MIAMALALLGCATGGGSGFDGGARRDSGQLDADVVDARTPLDAGRDAAPVDASGTVDAGRDSGTSPPDSGPGDAGAACPPTSARVAIVEVMVAALSGSTDRGEWIEILNAGDCEVDLGGTELVSGTAVFTMPSLVIPPGGRRVLAQSGDTAENHGLVVNVDYGSSGIVLDNGGDTIELRMGATTIDRVSWIATDHVASSSRMFPDGSAISGNDSQVRWCNSTSVYATVGTTMIRGTPGMGNGACP